jgi:hypothetical protein
MMEDDLGIMEDDLEIMDNDLEIIKLTRNVKIGPNWNPLEESSFSLQIIEDDMEMMEDSL